EVSQRESAALCWRRLLRTRIINPLIMTSALVPRPLSSRRWETAGWSRPVRIFAVAISLLAVALAVLPPVSVLVSADGLPIRLMDRAAIDDGWELIANRAESTAEGVRLEPSMDGVVALVSPKLDFSADVSPAAVISLRGMSGEEQIDAFLKWRRRGDPRDYEV